MDDPSGLVRLMHSLAILSILGRTGTTMASTALSGSLCRQVDAFVDRLELVVDACPAWVLSHTFSCRWCS